MTFEAEARSATFDAGARSATFGLVIRGGTIVDGLGGEPFVEDVAVRDGVICEVGTVDGAGDREIHVAFQAADVDAVRAFYDAALESGAESLHAPRLWPEYHPGYFGAFVRDPDGNNVEAVFHGAQPQA